jgi:hypothetical protein
MISSTTSSDHATRLGAVASSAPAVARPATAKPDKISTESAAFLRQALAAQPEIRPEVVERARKLAADPSYPSPEIIRSIGEQILGAPDLSEDQS